MTPHPHALAYDSDRQVTVMFGGLDVNAVRLDRRLFFHPKKWPMKISPSARGY
jgi:hypothetical protein